MRNRIISIIILLSIILLAIVMFRGIKIGNFEILSISQLKEKNDLLDKRIEAASQLTSVDYPKKIETLDKSFEEYKIKKEKYTELTGGSIENVEEMYETKKYDISYLWRTLGKYAENRGLSIGIDVQTSNSTNSIYNLNFSVSGEYTNIIRFITDLENDSDLYFRIYSFKMTGSSTVTATFTVKNININPDTIKSANSVATDSNSNSNSINLSKKSD